MDMHYWSPVDDLCRACFHHNHKACVGKAWCTVVDGLVACGCGDDDCIERNSVLPSGH